MKKFTYTNLVFRITIISFIFLSAILFPDTTIGAVNISGEISEDTVFVFSSNPYHIQGEIIVPRGVELRVTEGVEIVFDDNSSIFVLGNLIIEGTKDEPVNVKGTRPQDVWSIGIGQGGVGHISHASLSQGQYALGVFGGSLTIDNIYSDNIDYPIYVEFGELNASYVNIGGATEALTSIQSKVEIASSTFANNERGVYHKPFEVFPYITATSSDLSMRFGKRSNAVAFQNVTVDESNLNINNSIFEGNVDCAVRNDFFEAVDLEKNWWGHISGPSMNERQDDRGDIVCGSADTNPWLETRPDLSKETFAVIFIPGFQASRLYEKTSRGASRQVKLWEPIGERDIDKLWMNASGTSVRQIHPRSIIDKAYGLFSVYDGLIDGLNDFRSTGDIVDWQAVPYDWRLSVSDSVSKVREVYDRFRNQYPNTGIIILAHSNGGLLNQAFLRDISGKGDNLDAIRKVIMFGSPLLGAPKAVASLLHGFGQDIPFSLSSDKAREFGRTMPGAYGLLPHEDYLDSDLNEPIINFGSSNLREIGQWKNQFGNAINSFAEMTSFLVGSIPEDSSHIAIPQRLDRDIFERIQSTYKIFSTILIPQRTVNIIGAGIPTPISITYEYIKRRFVTFINQTFLGDGTVPYDSISGGTYKYLDLGLYNEQNDASIEHSTILAYREFVVPLLQLLITNIQDTDFQERYVKDLPPPISKTVLPLKIDGPVLGRVIDPHGNVIKNGSVLSMRYGIPWGVQQSHLDSTYNSLDQYLYLRDGYNIEFEGRAIGLSDIQYAVPDGTNLYPNLIYDMPVTPVSNYKFIGISTSTHVTADFDGDGIYEWTHDIRAEGYEFSEKEIRDIIDRVLRNNKSRHRISTIKLPELHINKNFDLVGYLYESSDVYHEELRIANEQNKDFLKPLSNIQRLSALKFGIDQLNHFGQSLDHTDQIQ